MPRRDFKTNQNTHHVFWRFALAAAVAGVLLFISSASVKAAWDMYQTFDAAAAERAAAEIELAAIKAEYESMSAVIAQFGTARGFETTVRERFGVVRPGEGEIRIVRAEPGDVVEAVADTNPFSRLFNALLAW